MAVRQPFDMRALKDEEGGLFRDILMLSQRVVAVYIEVIAVYSNEDWHILILLACWRRGWVLFVK